MNFDKILDNTNFKILITFILALYSGLAAPALPNNVIKFFDTTIGRLIFVFLITYMAGKNIEVAIMISIGFVVTIYILNNRQIEHFKNSMSEIDNLLGDINKTVDKHVAKNIPLANTIHEVAAESNLSAKVEQTVNDSINNTANILAESIQDATNLANSEEGSEEGIEEEDNVGNENESFSIYEGFISPSYKY